MVDRLDKLVDAAGRDFARSLSELLRAKAEVKFAGVATLAYSQFVRGLASPTCVSRIACTALGARLAIDLSPSILYPVIDRMLGGSGQADSVIRRAPTDIELRLAARVVKLFLTALRSACEAIVSIEPSIERMESDPKLIELASGNESIVLCSFELAIGEARGTLDLAMPERAARLLRAEPSRRASHSELVVVLAETSITAEQLADLAIGDIITTDTPIDTPLTIRIDGAAALKVRPGARAGRKAVRVVSE